MHEGEGGEGENCNRIFEGQFIPLSSSVLSPPLPPPRRTCSAVSKGRRWAKPRDGRTRGREISFFAIRTLVVDRTDNFRFLFLYCSLFFSLFFLSGILPQSPSRNLGNATVYRKGEGLSSEMSHLFSPTTHRPLFFEGRRIHSLIAPPSPPLLSLFEAPRNCLWRRTKGESGHKFLREVARMHPREEEGKCFLPLSRSSFLFRYTCSLTSVENGLVEGRRSQANEHFSFSDAAIARFTGPLFHYVSSRSFKNSNADCTSPLRRSNCSYYSCFFLTLMSL